jgi:hypothetical protein
MPAYIQINYFFQTKKVPPIFSDEYLRPGECAGKTELQASYLEYIAHPNAAGWGIAQKLDCARVVVVITPFVLIMYSDVYTSNMLL